MNTFELVLLLACLTAVSAGLLPAASYEKNEDADTPSYNFSYDVQDAETGDYKSQSESRNGDVVRGQYALNDADGYRRIVDYSVDGESGFQAVVRREPLTILGAADTALPQPRPSIQASSSGLEPLKESKVVAKPLRPSAAYISSYAHPTLLHHAPSHTLIHHHSSPAVHLAPSAHYIHSAAHVAAHTPGQTIIHHALPAVHLAPSTQILHAAPATTLLKHSPAVIHHHGAAVVKTSSFSTPHVSYVY